MKPLIICGLLGAGVVALLVGAPRADEGVREGVSLDELQGTPFLRPAEASENEPSTGEEPGSGAEMGREEKTPAAGATIPNGTVPPSPSGTGAASLDPAPIHPPSIEESGDLTVGEEGVVRLTFRVLAGFEYRLPDPMAPKSETAANQIPDDILALDGKSVSIEGYMVPLNSDGGRIQSFYLSRDVFGCCFGDMPRINEVIEVQVDDQTGVPMSSGVPVLVTGTFDVGEEKDEFGYINSIYRIAAQAVREKW